MMPKGWENRLLLATLEVGPDGWVVQHGFDCVVVLKVVLVDSV